ncbi:MAG: molybdopterin oxidoreductase [Calditrichaeota bacterium]|nr:MAG: molybdopterin oxidoreductase [Calditrichota bacterium]
MAHKTYKWLTILTGILGTIGVASVIYRLIAGMKITWLSSSVPWGMWVALYIYFIGLSAGSFLFSTLIYVFGQKELEKAGRLALLSAVLALVAGLFFVWIDLGHPFRIINIAFHWNSSSVLAWEILFYVFYITCVFAELWFLMRCDLAYMRDQSHGFKKKVYKLLALGWQCPTTIGSFRACHSQSLRVTAILGAIGVPLAIGVHGGTGAIFAVVKARPYWYSPIFPIIFLVSALVSGAGLMTFLYAFLGDKKAPDHHRIVLKLSQWLMLFLGVDVLLMITELLVGIYGSIPDHIAVWNQIMFGEYWYVFWIGQMGLTVLTPILFFVLKKGSTFWMGMGGLAVATGIISVRFNLVIPAFVTPPIPHLDEVMNHIRLSFEYFPSPMEWISSIGIIALVVFFFLQAYKFLPVFEHYKPHLMQGTIQAKEVNYEA